jgi:hypothetical protein
MSESANGDARADEIKALCRDYAEDMIDVLTEIARDIGEKAAPRVKAAETILQMGFGAPARKVEKTVDVTLHDHRSASLAAFKKLALIQEKKQLLIPHVQDAEFEDVTPTKEAKNR